MPEVRRTGQPFGVPGDVFARHTQSGVLAVEVVQIQHVGHQHAMDLADLRLRQVLAGPEEMLDLAEQPRATLRCTAYHHRIRTGILQHVPRFFRGGDVTVGDDGDVHAGLDRRDGVVLGIAGVGAGAGAAMYRQRLDAGRFGYPGDAYRVAILLVPAGAYLQCDRHVHRADYRFQQPGDQGFVLQQRGTSHHVADLPGRATHVDVDDLRAAIDIVSGGLRQHTGVGPDDLHRDRIGLAFMVGAAPGFFRTVQQRVGRDHLAHRHARTHALAQHAERAIGHSRHRGNNEIVFQFIRPDTHLDIFRRESSARGCDYK